jgi:hypothetical protein
MPGEGCRDKDGNSAEVKIDGSVSHGQRSAADLHHAFGVRGVPGQSTIDSTHPGAKRHAHFGGFYTDKYAEQR